MALIPPELIPIMGAAVAAFAADQIFFGGKYISQILDKASGNAFDIWTLRPETHFKGTHVTHLKVLGYKKRISNNGMERLTLMVGFKDDRDNWHNADADDLDYEPQVLKRWGVERFDIGLRSDRLKEMQEENDQLRYRVATANTKANLAFTNSVDFTTKMTASMGEWKKNIGTQPPMMMGKTGLNQWSSQQQAEGERDGEG
jgi:hypothetical protein